MKKFLLILTVCAFALALTAPAMAEVKLTTKGYMQVQGLMISNFPIKQFDDDGVTVRAQRANSWYNMEMIVEPTLHINDKVRIHSSVRVMERNYSGTSAGDLYASDAAQTRWSVFGDNQNNFWVERLYLSFEVPVVGGFLSVGRMSGGNWAYAWGDSDQNRDRIKYVTKFGRFTVLGVIEKRDERDGGLTAPRFNTSAAVNYQASSQDQEAYAIGAVLPFTPNIVFSPLWYGINDQAGFPYGDNNWHHIFLNGLMLKLGPVKLDLEVDYWYGTTDNEPAGVADEFKQWSIWGEATYAMGPASLGLGGFWLEGSDAKSGNDTAQGAFNTGEMFQPLLLLFSEDMGLFFASRGVPNGSVDAFGASGFLGFYGKADYKVTDNFMVKGTLGYLKADEMITPDISKTMGWELDLGFEWKFMNNVSYSVDAGYFWAGDYFKDVSNGEEDDVYGIRHTIKVEW